MKRRPDRPITVEEILGWFAAAKVLGATPESVAPLALALEQWRRHRADHAADAALQDMQRRVAEIRKAAGTLHRLIGDAVKVPDYGPVFARAPEVVDLVGAIANFSDAVPAAPRNRPPSEMVLTGSRIRKLIDRVVPSDASETARRRILRDALLRLGFDQQHPPGMKPSVLSLDDTAGLIRRRQRKGRGRP